MIKEEDLKWENDLWYYENKLFTGKAISYYGDKFWYKEGKLHRDNDLPAIEFSNGNKYWYKKGKLYRENGPAITSNLGFKEWYYNGEFINCKNNKDFKKIIKLLVFK